MLWPVPGILNDVEIEGSRWPDFCDNVASLLEVADVAGTMIGVIVIN